ncbi:NADPH:quinone reductase-like Zn-dependent oxidoreductase [Salinibacterium sp. CAN_S4]|uniref:alcohol dehydrogenase catalytic domain-containing protein n=1 Tax=Salinibacterium sp. CAN_S4 TaxID=2787727 RepID=UPI0018EF9B56
MRAWIADQSSHAGLSLRELPDPLQRDDEALIQVQAFAPNPGDLAALATADPGSVPGWDGAGTVIQRAPNGSGPEEGQSVIFLGSFGGWAQMRSVPTATIAVTPNDADRALMSAIPVPVTSALRALRGLGSLLGRRLLVVGANSAVGAATIQLAARSGAHVVAIARDRAAHERIIQLGAAEVHATMDTVSSPVFAAVDVVGGPHLVAAYSLLASGGTVITLGHAAGYDEHFPFGAFVAGPTNYDRSISTFFLGSQNGLDAEMEYLAAEVHAGRHTIGDLDQRSWTALGAWVGDDSVRSPNRTVFLVD